MPLGIIGKKIGMTQIFDENGSLVPVTVIQAGPCPVIAKRLADKDGYEAVAIGFDEKPERLVKRPEMGVFNKAGVSPQRIVREFRGPETQEFEVGQSLGVDLFAEGEHVDVVGDCKGKGFASVRKRWHSTPGPKTHGSMYHNRPGSNGASSDPSRTYKGKKNPGRLGGNRVTAQNLTVVKTLPEKNILLVKGSVPGANNSYVMIRKRRSSAAKAA